MAYANTTPPDIKVSEGNIATAGATNAAFIDAATVAQRIGVSIGTVRAWTNEEVLPAIRLKCGRRVIYHWPSVEAALVRMQRGGEQ